MMIESDNIHVATMEDSRPSTTMSTVGAAVIVRHNRLLFT